MSQDYTMYIIINNDLNMGKGKIASQVGHVVQHIIEDLLESYYNSNKKKDKYSNYLKWKNGCKKIVLKASQSDLLYCLENYDCVPVYDLGKTVTKNLIFLDTFNYIKIIHCRTIHYL